MKNAFFAALLAALALTACSKKDDSPANPAAATAYDGTVTWTTNGSTYTSTLRSSAIADSGDKIIVTAGSDDNNNIVSLSLLGINARGAGAYDLRRGAAGDNLPAAGLTLGGGTASPAVSFYTLYGPAASNGTITVSEYSQAGQRLSGTFSFVAGGLPNTNATGTRAVTNGSFSFSKFR